MDESRQKLRQRLVKIWEPPDLHAFFEKYAKRPPHLVKKGTVLFNAGDPLNGLYFIKEGFIKLYRVSADGRETIIYLTGPGNLLGLRALLSDNECAHHYTETITDAKIYTMTRKDFFETVIEHPEFLVDLVHVFADRLNHAEQRLEGFIATDATARVASFLSDYARRFEKKQKKSIEISLPLTHQRIAEFVGSFRETVTLALRRLEKEGVLKVERAKVTILNLRKLNQYKHLHKT